MTGVKVVLISHCRRETDRRPGSLSRGRAHPLADTLPPADIALNGGFHMRTHSTLTLVVAASLAGLAATGCKGGPMDKPIKTSPIEKGSDTIQGARQQLEGHWTLVSLVITNAAGNSATVQA